VTYSQPQQSGGKPNRLSLWINTRKTAPNQPDYKGNVEITWDLLQEMQATFAAGRYTQDYSGRPCLKLDVAIYAQQPDNNKPIMSGRISTVAETEHGAALREQARAQTGYNQPPAQPPGPPAMPQQPAPAPPMAQQAYPQAPPAPAAPAGPVGLQPLAVAPPQAGAIHSQPPVPVAAGAQLPPGF
jgi:hypothetical protein